MLLSRPELWTGLPLYFLVNAAALLNARRRHRLGTRMWERRRPEAPEVEKDSVLAPAK